jgi:ribonuclease BN (tRNA processing enzyme)
MAELQRYIRLEELSAIWISHLHPDHCADLGMAWHSLAYGPRRSAPLPVLGPPGWPRVLPEEPGSVFTVVELAGGDTHRFGELTLRAVAMRHSLPTFGLRAECADRTLSYTADSAPCDAIVELARDADLFLAEAFLSLPDELPFTSVSRPEDAGRAAARGDARRLVLTHLHPDADPAAAIARAATEFAGPIEVAAPGNVFEV